MDLKRMGQGYEGVGWIYLAQERGIWLVLVTTVLKLPVPRKELQIQDTSGSIVEDRGTTTQLPGRSKAFSRFGAPPNGTGDNCPG
jgi:hypothetical protein